MGRTNTALTSLQTALTSAGLNAILDPRQARPGAVLIDATSVEVSSINGAQILLVVPVIAMDRPPANLDASSRLNDLVDAIIDAVPAVSSRPGEFFVGGQDLPAVFVEVHWAASN